MSTAEKNLDNRFHNIIERSLDGILIISTEGKIVFVNPAAQQIFDNSSEALLGVDFGFPVSPGDISEIEILSKKEKYKIVEMRVTETFWDGETALLVELRDVTALRKHEEDLLRAKEEAEQANKAKTQFLAKMSHEIRTPMNGILGMTELALNTELDDKQREYLQMVQESAHALLTLINDILDISRIEAGKMELVKQDFEMKDSVQKIVQSLQPIAAQKKISLSFLIDDEISGRYYGDNNKLRQILFNIIGNALKYTEKGRCILKITRFKELAPEPGRTAVYFQVRDTGIGISEDGKRDLFELFTQSDDSYSRNFEGAGLGLAISKQLIEMMSGKIWFKSVPDEGTTFHFYVFLEKARNRTEPNEEKKEFSPIQLPKTLNVLVVEDNRINRKVISAMLNKIGSRAVLASSGQGGVETAEEEEFDLILMDIEMPGMNGIEAAKRIKEREREKKKTPVPIVALTAHSLKGDKEFFLQSGFNGYISKPISMEELKKTIHDVLSGSNSGTLEDKDLEKNLKELAGSYTSSPQLLAQMLELFRGNMPRLIDEMIEAFEQQDMDKLSQAAHSLANNAGVVGATEMVGLARAAILSCEKNDGASLRSQLSRLQTLKADVLFKVINFSEQLKAQ